MEVYPSEPLAGWEKELLSAWLLDGGHPDIRRPFFISQPNPEPIYKDEEYDAVA